MKVMIPYRITDAMLSSASVPEADYAAWASGMAYVQGARVIRTAGLHLVYERLTTGSGATPPESDPSNWIEVGPTNRWAMLDESVGSSTTAAGSLSVSLSLPGSVGDVVLLGVKGSTVTITAGGSTVASVPVPVPFTTGAGSTVTVLGLALAGPVTLGVAVTGTGTVAVGSLAVGTFTTIGETERGMQIGIQDYSAKTFDTYGAAAVSRRAYSRKLSGSFTLLSTSADQTARILAAARSRPAMWMGLSWVSASVVYGIVSDWSLPITKSLCRGSITIKSLALGL